MNSETLIFLQFWVARDLFEFEKASRFYGNSFHDPCPFYANRTMLLFGVTCVIPMSIMLVRVLIMHTVLILIRLYL